MGDKNVKKKIIIISIGLILLNPVNIFAKPNDDGLYKSSYSQNYIKYDKDPINKPSIGTNLYIISSDEILQLYNGTRKRADTVLGYNCKYYFAYAIENKKTNFLEFKYNNINYYIPLIESTRVSNVSDIRSLQHYYTIYSDSKEGNTDFHESNFSKNEQLSDAINEFNELNSSVDSKDEFKIWENLAKVMYDMKLEYGGSSYDQGNLDGGKTKCDGFTWIVSQLLSNTDISYRFVHIMDGYRSNRNVSHVLLEIKAPDGDWKLFECTGLAYDSNKDYKYFLNYVNREITSKLHTLPRDKMSYMDKNGNPYINKEYFISKVYKRGLIDEMTKYENVREVNYGGCIYE